MKMSALSLKELASLLRCNVTVKVKCVKEMLNNLFVAILVYEPEIYTSHLWLFVSFINEFLILSLVSALAQ